MGALRDSGRLLTAGVLAAACFLAVAARPGRADTVIMKSGVTYRSMGAPSRQHARLHFRRAQAHRGARLED